MLGSCIAEIPRLGLWALARLCGLGSGRRARWLGLPFLLALQEARWPLVPDQAPAMRSSGRLGGAWKAGEGGWGVGRLAVVLEISINLRLVHI